MTSPNARRGAPHLFLALPNEFTPLRLALISLAVLIVFWAGAVFPIFWSDANLNRVGTRIAAGEPMKQVALLELRPQLEELAQRRWPTPESLYNAASIELKLAEAELETGAKISGNIQFARAQASIESALRTTPSDAFLWASLFWLVKTRDGLQKDALSYLRMSYLTGPNEGWVAVRRSRMLAPILTILPKDLAELAVAEYGKLVTSGYIAATVDILTGSGWPNRELLLSSLANTPIDLRWQFSDAIYDKGFDVAIPGIVQHGGRPWK